MRKFRRRQITRTYDAEQFLSALSPPVGVCQGGPTCETEILRDLPNCRPHVHTIHGEPVHIQLGDWVMPEPDGMHYYPVKPDIFEETYEEIVEFMKPTPTV